MIDKIHSTRVLGLDPTEELGKAIVAMRYDCILPIIEGMIQEAQRQEKGDRGRGRVKLAERLALLVGSLEDVREDVEHLVTICRPYIEEEKRLQTEE
jgi:hypothetical protein